MSSTFLVDPMASVCAYPAVEVFQYTSDRVSVRQKKTGRPVRFELTEQTRQAVDEYLRATNKKPASSCSQDVEVPKKASPRASMRAWYRIGSAVPAGSEAIWDAFTATHQSDPVLSAHRKSQGGPASARAHQDRKHRQISGHRGR